jgi:hypothetical protein
VTRFLGTSHCPVNGDDHAETKHRQGEATTFNRRALAETGEVTMVI